MRGLWEILIANPILFFVLAAWIAGGIGQVLKSRGAARRQEERERRRASAPSSESASSPRPRPTPSARSSGTSSAAGPVEPRRASASGPPPLTAESGRRAPDDVAAEMRRILGLDDVEVVRPEPSQGQRPDLQPTRAPEVMPRSEPIVRERSGPIVERPVPLSAAAATRMLEKRIDPHVGEGISQRKSPRSRVGQHDASWGSLGGRHRADSAVELARGGVERHVDLTDIKRVILGAEILGPPIALRDPGQERMI